MYPSAAQQKNGRLGNLEINELVYSLEISKSDKLTKNTKCVSSNELQRPHLLHSAAKRKSKFEVKALASFMALPKLAFVNSSSIWRG